MWFNKLNVKRVPVDWKSFWKSDYERCIFWNIHICLRSSSTCTYILTWWSFSEILLMMLAQRLIKQDRNLALWMHSEVNYPQVSSMYNIIHINLLTIKSCSVIWQLNFSFECSFFCSPLWVEQNNNITSKAVSEHLQGQVHEVADRTRYTQSNKV